MSSRAVEVAKGVPPLAPEREVIWPKRTKEKLANGAGALPLDHQQLARGRSNLGQLLCKQRRYAEAEKFYRQAVKVQEANLRRAEGAERGPQGFRSGVDVSYGGVWVAIGPTGEDISWDGGKHWKHSASLNLNAVTVLRDGYKFSEVEVTEVHFLEKLDEKVFAQP